jgi:hypothetical protein
MVSIEGEKMWWNLMTITQPLTKKMPIGKARLTIIMPSLKGKKIHQKGQLYYELDQEPRRCKAAS